MRTRLSICRKKARYPSEAEALLVVQRAAYPLRPYRCDRCFAYHLTGRIKGKWLGGVGGGRNRLKTGGLLPPDPL